MASFQPAAPRFAPTPPQTIDELAIPQTLVVDLMLRRLLLEGVTTLQSLTQKLKLSINIVDYVFRHMRQQQLVEVKGMLGNDYQFTLSAAGRALASERFQISQYAGGCPVSLRDYQAATNAQVAQPSITRQSLRDAFSDLVVTDRMLDQIGPALIAQRSIFIYGPTGNGKTALAERMLRVYNDSILVPYAVEVDGQVISVYDPVVHHAIEHDDPHVDPRWVCCRRPCIMVGGELVPNMLELRLDDLSGIYAAPLQMKANNGILIIDDFGRQLMSPRDLLNRWIVPLDRRVDYLTLRYGVKFQIPFELMVVFSTNLDPADLADDAFLRRIQNKILVDPVDAGVFDQIFARLMTTKGIDYDPDTAKHLRTVCLQAGGSELRACYPGDITDIIESISQYERREPVINRVNLERAAHLYFARTSSPSSPSASSSL
jgi:predicted ATPase with chaperone activity